MHEYVVSISLTQHIHPFPFTFLDSKQVGFSTIRVEPTRPIFCVENKMREAFALGSTKASHIFKKKKNIGRLQVLTFEILISFEKLGPDLLFPAQGF